MKLLISIVCFLSAINISAQNNLVYNGDFEQYSICPNFVSQIENCQGWKHGIYSVDYINSCAPGMDNWNDRGYDKVGVPNNFFGYSYPKSGNAYISLFVGYFNQFVDTNDANVREWAQGELYNPLTDDTLYTLKFSVAKPDYYGYTNNNIGIYLSDTLFPYLPGGMPVPDSIFHSINTQLVFNINETLCDTSNWHEYSFSFKASGGEKYIYIGNFFPHQQTNYFECYPPITNNLDSYYACYYFIDDVKLYKNDSITSIPETSNTKIVVYPNPAHDYITINLQNTDFNNSVVSLYNAVGQLAYKETITNNQFSINTTGLPPGLYTLDISQGNLSIARQKVAVLH